MSAPVRAQQVDPLAEMVREVAEGSVAGARLGAGDVSNGGRLDTSHEWLTIRRRDDLERLIEVEKPAREVRFYEVQSAPGTISEGSLTWVVAAVRSRQGAYTLYSFLGPEGPDAPSKEFNRFTSDLGLSIRQDKAESLARLFLGSCVEGDAKEVVLDDDTEVRLAVQDYYMAAYGDLWRALDAYSRWWRGFNADSPDLAPVVGADKDGRYRVVLTRLLTFTGKQPQVQKWELQISRTGDIQVSTMHLISPTQPSLMFYDLDTWKPTPPLER